jgi:hypothetical protein
VLLTKSTFHWLTSILSSFNADIIVVSGIVITPLVVLKCPYLWLAANSFDSRVSVERKKAGRPYMWVDICTCKFPLHCRSINCYVENELGFISAAQNISSTKTGFTSKNPKSRVTRLEKNRKPN